MSPTLTVWPLATLTVATVPLVSATALTVALALVTPRSGTLIGIALAVKVVTSTERTGALVWVAASRCAMVSDGSTVSPPVGSCAFASSVEAVSALWLISEVTDVSPLPGPCPPCTKVPLPSQTPSTSTITSAAPYEYNARIRTFPYSAAWAAAASGRASAMSSPMWALI